jgi:zinc/manganese transport system substrate-binding protein
MLSRRFLLLVACLIAAFCVLPPVAFAQKKVRVVASFSILGDLVRQVGGDSVEVTTLVGPDGDAHTYTPTPADSVKIQQADLVAINGISFEMWADRLVRAANYKGARLVASRGIKALRAGGAADPHAWQDVRNVKLYAANIRDALAGVDPAGAADYEARAAAYLAKLDELDAEIRATFDAIPKVRRKVITSHDAFTYFGDAYDVVFHSPQGLSTDAAPSSRGVAALIRQIKVEGIKAVFVENMTNPRMIEQIAKETGVKLGGRLYSDALSSGPPADTYIDLMRHNTRLLAAAMR